MLLGKYWDKFGSIRPGKISIEDVRSLYGISRLEARTLCEMAVSEGLFEKKVGLTCPSPGCNGRIIAEFDLGSKLPEEILCVICEADGIEPSTYKTDKLEKVEYYKLANYHVHN